MRIFIRPSEWDYRWLKKYPAEVSLARHYEFARYALLRASGDSLFVFPQEFRSTEASFQLLSSKEQLGPAFILSCFLPAKVKFPLLPWREARKFLTACDPARLSTIIEEFASNERPNQQMVNFYVRFKAAEEAAEVLAQLEAQSPLPKSRRKASAHSRREREATDLKYLGATKLLDSPMSAPDAIILTTETLGRPLLANESEWSRAKRRVGKILEPHNAEAAALMSIFCPNPLRIKTRS